MIINIRIYKDFNQRNYFKHSQPYHSKILDNIFIETRDDTFINTLLKTNKTYKYFVDWVKVKNNVRKFKYQIFLLNSLRDIKDRDEIKKEFIDLLVRYPEVLKVIPLLIAERVKNGKIDILDPDVMDFVQYDFKKRRISKEEAEKYVYFSEKVGIVDLLMEIKDLYDYLLGVEVGLDTNSRKNRSADLLPALKGEGSP